MQFALKAIYKSWPPDNLGEQSFSRKEHNGHIQTVRNTDIFLGDVFRMLEYTTFERSCTYFDRCRVALD